ncbi:hypothetical protein QYS47_24805 [Marivirga arenosa]|uniref:Uncharacterized protein n=2 Tax=Marivirga arenosa TaxID=3059076 RepID=A0AA49GGC4_9BACT|nr:hypothetical protein QYS47_24805 [Marivirga sp. BKB1-2]
MLSTVVGAVLITIATLSSKEVNADPLNERLSCGWGYECVFSKTAFEHVVLLGYENGGPNVNP